MVILMRDRQPGFSAWPYLVFVILFSLLLLGVCKWYLIQAMDDFGHADKLQKRLLGLHAMLIMIVLLLIAGLGLLLSFRMGRYFSRRPPSKNTPTKYVDAWSESAKRMKTPPKE